MVLGKLSRLGRPTNLDSSMARAYCASIHSRERGRKKEKNDR